MKFFEKPESEEITTSRLASVVFYCLRRKTLKKVDKYLGENQALKSRSFGHFVNWLVKSNEAFYAMKIPTRFQLIGHVGLADYQKWSAYFADRNLGDKRFISVAVDLISVFDLVLLVKLI